MKRSRPLSLFLSVLILITCFTVSVSAADSENLIDSDLREWHNVYPETTKVFYRTRIADGVTYAAYGFTSIGESIDSDGYKLKASYVYDLTPLVSGNSYSFNFHLLNFEEANFITHGISEENYYGGLINGNGLYVIGVASYDATNGNFIMVDNAYINITKDNYLEYYGKDNVISFVLPNIVNPCLVIEYLEMSKRNYQQNIYLNNISLVDNEQAKEDGFFAKLFDWFQEKFDSIGESFSNLGNKLTELKNSFLDSLSNLGDTIGSFFDEQLEGIIDFFRGFGNLILYFNWEGVYTNPFERENSPIDKVSSFFDDLIEYVDSIGTSIENVLDSITGGLHIFDEFTSRFPWLKGIAMFCLAIIVLSRFIGL